MNTIIQPKDIHSKDLISLIIVADNSHDLDTRLYIPYVNLKDLAREANELWDAGIRACKLFVYMQDKRDDASSGLESNTLMVRAIQTIKEAVPDITVMTEVCACAYSKNGECVLVLRDRDGIDDKATHEYVGKMAKLHAWAGCDVIVAGLTHDGSVRAIRNALDADGHTGVAVMASIQMKSSFYGPYRAMMNTEPEAGETFRSQIDYRDPQRAIRLLHQFEEEGATLFTIQPAMATVDILTIIRRETDKPISTYSVSSELPVFTGPDRQLLPEKAPVAYEYFSSLRRAGADTVMTYVAKDFAKWLNESQND